MPRPVAYLRKSKSDDPAKEVSREVQEHAVRTLASRDGFNGDLKLYVDWDRSADQSKSARRTAYREMVRAIEAGEVSVVYAYATDRLYRSVSTFIELMKTARDHGARIVTERDGVVGGDGSPMANAFAQVGAVFAELELNTAKSRARAAHAVRVARGDFVGNPPYGWRVAKDAGGVNRLEPDPEKPVAPILEAFERSGRRPRSAVRILNDELGIPAQHGGTWDTASLSGSSIGRRHTCCHAGRGLAAVIRLVDRHSLRNCCSAIAGDF